MRAGKMRHRISLHKLVLDGKDRDKFGSVKKETQRVGTFWCRVRYLSNETTDGNIRQNQSMVEFEVRYSKDLSQPMNNNMYITFNGQEYDIESVINPEFLNQKLLVTCKLRG